MRLNNYLLNEEYVKYGSTLDYYKIIFERFEKIDKILKSKGFERIYHRYNQQDDLLQFCCKYYSGKGLDVDLVIMYTVDGVFYNTAVISMDSNNTTLDNLIKEIEKLDKIIDSL